MKTGKIDIFKSVTPLNEISHCEVKLRVYTGLYSYEAWECLSAVMKIFGAECGSIDFGFSPLWKGPVHRSCVGESYFDAWCSPFFNFDTWWLMKSEDNFINDYKKKLKKLSSDLLSGKMKVKLSDKAKRGASIVLGDVRQEEASALIGRPWNLLKASRLKVIYDDIAASILDSDSASWDEHDKKIESFIASTVD